MANAWKAIEGERQQRQDMADKTQESLHHVLEAAAAAATTKLPWNHHLRSSRLLQIPPSKLQPRTPYQSLKSSATYLMDRTFPLPKPSPKERSQTQPSPPPNTTCADSV